MDKSRLTDCVLLLLCVSFPLSTAVQPPYQSGQKSRDVNKIAGQWGEWGLWSSCSVKCGTGVSSRTRRCEHPLTLPVSSLIIRADDSVVCEGGGREIRVCNTHKCPPNIENVRLKQCRKFNARVFNGKKYEWEPYINPNNKCELTCRAKGQHFYARLANRVGDGTPCDLKTFSVCIRRQCIKVGCDDQVGSNATLDKCGVCNGDNSTCRTISGVFTRPDLPHGYTKIISIPVGSTGVNITELRPSSNYLSLKTSTESFVNGNWTMSSSGNYDAAGTTFIYKEQSRDCPGECIFAAGPVNQTIEVLMLVYQTNPGVTYSFNVPVDVTDTYFKHLISRSEESRVLTTSPTTAIPRRRSTTAQSEFANLELDEPADVHLDMEDSEKEKRKEDEDEDEEASEPFREDFVERPYRHPNEDLEEGVMAGPDIKEDNIRGSFGRKEYTFHEGNGATVLLKANVDSWSERANLHEAQSQKGPTFVLSELGSQGEEDSDTSLEVVDGAAVLKQQGEEQVEKTDVRDEGGEQEGDEDEEEEGERITERQHERQGNDRNVGVSREPSHLGDEMKVSETGDSRNVEIEGEEEQGINDLDDEHDDDDVDDDDDDDAENDDKEDDADEEKEETYDKSRGDEVLGLGDGFRERTPVYNSRGYRLPNAMSTDTAETETRKMDSSLGGYSLNTPTTRVHFTTTVTPLATVRSTLNVPQRDSRFRTYSRSLGRSSVQPSIRRTGRPFGRPGRRGSVRIPKYSQSFTFRERFKILREAQKKRLLRQRQKLIQKGDISSISPSVNRHISSSSSLPSIQGTDTSRIRSQHGGIRQTSHIRGQSTTPQSHHVRHRHHHRQAAVVTTPPLGSVGRNSQGLRLRETVQRRVNQGKQRAGSSITLKANVNASPSERDQQSGPNYRRNENQGNPSVHGQDNHGYGSQTSSRRPSPGHQPSLNARVAHSSRRTINSRDPPPRPNQTPRRQTVDHRTIVDETLPLGHFDRAIDPRGSDRRIVIPRQPVGVSTGQQIIPQQPVISSRPRYEGHGPSTQVGEPLTKYANGLDPISGLPPINPGSNQALTAGKSYTRNIIPNEKRLGNPTLNGGLSNEILEATNVWRVSGFTDCTTSCGGGVQQTVVVCVNTRNQAVVTDENCARLHKPAPTAVTCNTRPCPASWEVSPWSTCTTTCGPGTQTRTATCKSRVSVTLNLTMPDSSCNAEKPATAQTCEITPCYLWVTGNWSKCSSRCGEGRKQRVITCTDAAGTVVTSQLCTGLKPAAQEICDMGSCGKGWYSTRWPEECPVTCGEGTMKRKTMCAGEEGVALDPDRCDQLDKPRVEKTCKVDTPCGGNWFVGEWSKCNGTCGYAVRSRDVACVKNLPGGVLAVVTEDNCKGKEKPETGEECQLPECHPEWYMTSWAECSKSCGTGYRTREVKCLAPNQQPSAECPTRGKPRTREPCNTQSCVARPKPTSKSGGSCTDSFSQCQLVKKARLCRYGYYAKMCCLSCSNET
ncbi:A disintegrin and metalloproteinase with thrombospondin motifs 9-like [Haliotis asinina]|uniref:A disintegrin and metalloproteinase with thrombospondin motifs 9-like n=1 Tax=Haliotis asinina TaxID=109174 RepID=UPI003531EE72